MLITKIGVITMKSFPILALISTLFTFDNNTLFAMEQNTPNVSEELFDCSNFVQYCYEALTL